MEDLQKVGLLSQEHLLLLRWESLAQVAKKWVSHWLTWPLSQPTTGCSTMLKKRPSKMGSYHCSSNSHEKSTPTQFKRSRNCHEFGSITIWSLLTMTKDILPIIMICMMNAYLLSLRSLIQHDIADDSKCWLIITVVAVSNGSKSMIPNDGECLFMAFYGT